MNAIVGSVVRAYLRLFLLGTPTECREDLWREQMLLVFSVEESFRVRARGGDNSVVASLHTLNEHLTEFWPTALLAKRRFDLLAVGPSRPESSLPSTRSASIVMGFSGLAALALCAGLLMQTGTAGHGVGFGWAETLETPVVNTPSR